MERLPLPARIVRPLGYPQVVDLPEKQQVGLRAFWLDGLFAAIASGFVDSYYSLYMLSLRASNAQIGLVNTLTQLISAIMAMPGAAIADRTGRYKRVVLMTGVIYRLMWPVMLVAPWILDETAVWLVLAAWVGLAGVGALGNAAWTALSADLVPARLRGGYFASRNIIIQMVGLVAIPLAGQLVNVFGEPEGYQINLGLAFSFSLGSLYYYSKLPEHPPSAQPDRLSTRQALRHIAHMPTFKRFVTGHAVLQLGVMFSGPFLTVYMAEDLEFDTGTIGLVTTVGVLASLIAMRILGRAHDRLGMIRTMRFGMGIPLIPVAWLFVQAPWQGYLVSIFSSLTWAGYNLGAFNLLLASTPDEHRPRYVAIYTTITSIVGAIGPALGGLMLDLTGFAPVFIASGALRGLGLVLFFVLVRGPDSSLSHSASHP